MRTLIPTLTLALLACAEEPTYHHEPSLSIHGGWEASAEPTLKWIGTETVDGPNYQGCTRGLTAVELAPACADCAITLEITEVDERAWCDVGGTGPGVGDVVTFELTDATEGTLLLDEGDVWTPYATGELVDDALVYERLRARPSRDFHPDDLRDLRDEPVRM